MTDRNNNHPCQEAIANAGTPDEVDLPLIDPLNLEEAEKTADMIDHIFARSGYNARRLAEAAKIYSMMIDTDATICLTLAGAMTPIGMSGVINSLIRAGFIDCIIATGANLYHDLHRPFDRPMMQGHFAVDDNELADTGIARIYDVFIEDEDTLMATDRIILETVEAMDLDKPLSTAEFHHALGLQIARSAKHPQWSTLVTAAQHNVPVYTPSPGDSTIAMNLAVPHMFGKKIQLDTLKDVIETAAIVRSATRNGVVVLGGGSPKNFYFQTQPTLQQIFRDESKGGHDYVIQLTTDAPHWGGLSGATISEAKSWGKVKDAHSNSVVVYSCASLTFPLLAQYVLVRNRPRTSKKLFARLPEITDELYQKVKTNPKFLRSLEKFRSHYDL
ncbi:MAG: deoxyhypusine synthase family protein [Planctomycetota bacterium]|jgi:deoxyhypusine synthase